MQTELRTTRNLCLSLIPLTIMACASMRGPSSAGDTKANLDPGGNDPFQWLEEIESPKALDWVKGQNRRSEGMLKATDRYRQFEPEIRKIVLAKDRIPAPGLRNGWVYNFWQDASHVKGIWRRARPEEYAKTDPTWETVLDLDELNTKEKANWVWHGPSCLPPSYERCLLKLSPGGKDAVVVREFDVATKAFVPGGFTLPEAKSNVDWLDQDTLLAGTDFGPGSVTDSGYPRQIRLWKRGTEIRQAPVIFEGKTTDVSAYGSTYFRPEGNVTVLSRSPSFFEEENWIFVPGSGKKVRIPLPGDAELKGVFQGWLFGLLRSDWSPSGSRLPAGALVALRLDKLESMADPGVVEVIYSPDLQSSLQSVAFSKSAFYTSVLTNVQGVVHKYTRTKDHWQRSKVAFPPKGAISLDSFDPYDDRFFAGFESFLTPPTQYFQTAGKVEVLKSVPERFNATGLMTEQFWARSADGTKIPYYVIRNKNAPMDGSTPTLLYGYGGFEISMDPFYLSSVGKIWLEAGGAYVLANIRGGGEFGPRWHQAALLENRQKAYDDFIGVAEDLVARKLTKPAKLGIMGGSNGGLLVGAVMVQRPDLFGAVVCQVPLLDMMRYHRLLAGASWMAEYGNPDDPKMREVILKYSPYQNAKKNLKYPNPFFLTSTKDDRVHPGHARKMAAQLEAQGSSFLYYENTEGGHGGAADLEQKIHKSSMEFAYLFQMLF